VQWARFAFKLWLAYVAIAIVLLTVAVGTGY
jgi:hypothetical protein